MKLGQFFLLCEIMNLINEFDPRFPESPVLEFFEELVGGAEFVEQYMIAFQLLARVDFRPVLTRTLNDLIGCGFVILPVHFFILRQHFQRLRIGIELVNLKKGPIMPFGLPKHPFDMVFSVLNSVFLNWGQSSSIPVGTVLVRESFKSGIFTSTIPNSFWANCCPLCNGICVDKACSHMPPNSDQYRDRSRDMYSNITHFIFKAYFTWFCFQYAKIVTSFLMDQSIFSIYRSLYSLGRKNPVPISLEIPILPLSFLDTGIMQEMRCYFEIIKLDDGRSAMFPVFFMHMIARDNSYRRRQNHIRNGGICLKFAHCLTSLHDISGNTSPESVRFFESVMKRVLSHSKLESWYMAQNAYFCKNVVRILESFRRSDQSDQTNQLIEIFKRLDSFNS